jgi:phosphoribosylanthranilate isomerase
MRVARPRIKICGITRYEDAHAAAELGVEMLGFVCWPQSPRYLDPIRIRAIVRELPRTVAAVGVFVDQPLDEIAGVVESAGLGVVQLHGSEPESMWQLIGSPVIKAVGVTGRHDVRAMLDWPASVTPLLDAHDPVRKGGTGRVIDWGVAELAAKARPIVLSGGLTPDNVAHAIRTVRPWAVDVSSGVEHAPGVKDMRLMRAFVAAVRSGPETG